MSFEASFITAGTVGFPDLFYAGSAKDPLSVYMVFPYMDHDLAGLLENDRVKLQPSHIKLYMKQLLEGTEYMHRVRVLSHPVSYIQSISIS